MPDATKLFMNQKATVVTAWAERAAGPGWANSLIWIIERQPDGKLTQRALQPEEQTTEMMLLFNISESTHNAMVYAVNNAKRKKKKAA